MISSVSLRRFKQFADSKIALTPGAVTLVAGGNNAGKSSLLHGLAIWEFCKTAIRMEKGEGAFYVGAHHRGLGLGDDEFSPIAVPSLKHLWTNLKSQQTDDDVDGYTLRIRCEWSVAEDDTKHLEFAMALTNDRLFVRVQDTNLVHGDRIPSIAYLPPFAGMTDREMKLPQAIRRRRIGEGLAGAVLRNILLDMHDANEAERGRLRGEKTKIKDADLRRLRTSDSWELLQHALRERFSAELIVAPFREEYHSYIKVDVDKGTVSNNGYSLKRFANYNRRDLMVEGSGFLQWLSVYALATSRDVDVLLLDEPDAHLHPALQTQLLQSLADLASVTRKQVLVATHSVEILRGAEPDRILQMRSGGKAKYLKEAHQKVGLLAGLGSDYAPNLDPVRKHKKVLFIEGKSDAAVLTAFAEVLGLKFPEDYAIWQTATSHKERKQLHLALKEEIPGLITVSLRDRDDENATSVNNQLDDGFVPSQDDFITLKWRRRYIEDYLLLPAAIASATAQEEYAVVEALANNFGIAIGDTYELSDCPSAILDARGKEILLESDHALLGKGVGLVDIARATPADRVCEDISTFFKRVAGAFS